MLWFCQKLGLSERSPPCLLLWLIVWAPRPFLTWGSSRWPSRSIYLERCLGWPCPSVVGVQEQLMWFWSPSRWRLVEWRVIVPKQRWTWACTEAAFPRRGVSQSSQTVVGSRFCWWEHTCMHVVASVVSTLCNPMDCNPPQGSNPCLSCLLHWREGFSPLEPPGHTQYILIFLIEAEWTYNVEFFSTVQQSDSDSPGLGRSAAAGHGRHSGILAWRTRGQRSPAGHRLCLC